MLHLHAGSIIQPVPNMNCENKCRSIIYQKNYIMYVLLSEVKLWQRVPMTVQLMESESELSKRYSVYKFRVQSALLFAEIQNARKIPGHQQV